MRPMVLASFFSEIEKIAKRADTGRSTAASTTDVGAPDSEPNWAAWGVGTAATLTAAAMWYRRKGKKVPGGLTSKLEAAQKRVGGTKKMEAAVGEGGGATGGGTRVLEEVQPHRLDWNDSISRSRYVTAAEGGQPNLASLTVEQFVKLTTTEQKKVQAANANLIPELVLKDWRAFTKTSGTGQHRNLERDASGAVIRPTREQILREAETGVSTNAHPDLWSTTERAVAEKAAQTHLVKQFETSGLKLSEKVWNDLGMSVSGKATQELLAASKNSARLPEVARKPLDFEQSQLWAENYLDKARGRARVTGEAPAPLTELTEVQWARLDPATQRFMREQLIPKGKEAAGKSGIDVSGGNPIPAGVKDNPMTGPVFTRMRAQWKDMSSKRRTTYLAGIGVAVTGTAATAALKPEWVGFKGGGGTTETITTPPAGAAPAAAADPAAGPAAAAPAAATPAPAGTPAAGTTPYATAFTSEIKLKSGQGIGGILGQIPPETLTAMRGKGWTNAALRGFIAAKGTKMDPTQQGGRWLTTGVDYGALLAGAPESPEAAWTTTGSNIQKKWGAFKLSKQPPTGAQVSEMKSRAAGLSATGRALRTDVPKTDKPAPPAAVIPNPERPTTPMGDSTIGQPIVTPATTKPVLPGTGADAAAFLKAQEAFKGRQTEFKTERARSRALLKKNLNVN